MMSALDFGDLLLSTLRLFRQNPKVLDRYRSRFKHILVDEFQDVSPAQYDILRMLVMGSTTGRADIAGGVPGGLSAEEGGTDDMSILFYPSLFLNFYL
jgi:DNA helicase II / ATP-dependent DNA helicase PcrA